MRRLAVAAATLGLVAAGLLGPTSSAHAAGEGYTPSEPESSDPTETHVSRCSLYASRAGYGAKCASKEGTAGQTWAALIEGHGPFVECFHDEVPEEFALPEPPPGSGPGRWAFEQCLRHYDLNTQGGGPNVAIETALVWVPEGAWLNVPGYMTPIWKRVDSVFPTPILATGPISRPRVNVPTYFWLDPSSTSLPDKTVSDGVETITMRARVTRLVVEPGDEDGAKVVCDSAAEAYDYDSPPDRQRSTCKYTYKRSSASMPRQMYPARVHAYWEVTYQRRGQAPVRLGQFDITSLQLLPVQEVETVNR